MTEKKPDKPRKPKGGAAAAIAAPVLSGAPRSDPAVLRCSAEQRHAGELERLMAADADPRPPGWRLSARAVRRFILGDKALGVSKKFFGDDPLVDRAIVTLISAQGLMLVGEPGTAKSMLSELLASAISGSSDLVVQGSAGTTDDHIRYSWNYALLLAEGPSERALVPSPVLSAMRSGRVVRVEELTRCPPEIQDALISILSEKTIAIPELGETSALSVVRARPGFNVIATANLRDRGVHEMSSALKRRFNFETVHPISDPAFERELILSQLKQRIPDGIFPEGVAAAEIGEPVIELLVSTFQDLRHGRTSDGIQVAKPEAVMSTAEAVNVAHAALLEATFLGEGVVTASHVASQLQGVVLKDNPEDGRKFKAYVDQIAKNRGEKNETWREFHGAARKLRFGF